MCLNNVPQETLFSATSRTQASAIISGQPLLSSLLCVQWHGAYYKIRTHESQPYCLLNVMPLRFVFRVPPRHQSKAGKGGVCISMSLCTVFWGSVDTFWWQIDPCISQKIEGGEGVGGAAITKDALPNRFGRNAEFRRSDKAGLQYFNQSPRTRANLGRSLTFKTGFQTGLERVNGGWT